MNGKKLAFLGLGVMGYPMAGHLAKAGHDVTVYNRTGAKAAKWVEQHGGRSASSPSDAAIPTIPPKPSVRLKPST